MDRETLGWPRAGKLAVLVAAMASMFAGTAMSASLGWLKGDAASFFTDQDWTLVGEALSATLETAAAGETREWSNKDSGAGGKMTLLAQETRGDVTCRRVQIESRAKGASSSDRYLFCRRGEGSWGIGEPK